MSDTSRSAPFFVLGDKWLTASLVYGAELRLVERLRVGDIDSGRLCYADPHKMP